MKKRSKRRNRYQWATLEVGGYFDTPISIRNLYTTLDYARGAHHPKEFSMERLGNDYKSGTRIRRTK